MKSRVAYITGQGRSGTSLLDLLLSQHSKIHGVGEICNIGLFPEVHICSCRQTVHECEFWSDVAGHLKRRIGISSEVLWQHFPIENPFLGSASNYSRMKNLFSAYAPKWLNFLVRHFWEEVQWEATCAQNSWVLFDALEEITGSPWIIDSSKYPSRLLRLERARPGQVYPIVVVRHPGGYAYSNKRRDGTPVDQSNAGWLRLYRHLSHVLSRFPPSNSIVVMYESLCHSPESELRKISNFLGLGDENLSGTHIHKPNHLIPGSPMLLKPFQAISIDERWKHALSSYEIEMCNKTFNEFQRFDYFSRLTRQ